MIKMNIKTFDYLIVGGGLFGVYAAIYLSKKGYKVLIVEKESELLKKASIVNQARLHAGYHYPRSIATARIADAHKERFTREHGRFINFKFDKYYAIEKYGSATNSAQFKRFCDYLDIKAEKTRKSDLFKMDRIDCLFLTQEYSFDPILIAEYYKEKLNSEKNVTVKYLSTVVASEKEHDRWRVSIRSLNGAETEWVTVSCVINATYSGTNTVNNVFEVRRLKLVHEITELAMISSPELQNIGLTVMDGHFCSLMPYGLSNLLSLSSVTYTHHKVSRDDEPSFDCQAQNIDCTPSSTSICGMCPAKPRSNYNKMISQMRKYLADGIGLDYIFSMFTIKTKLQSSYIDDGRPTEISLLNDTPPYYCLFAGKINSIYEIESEVLHV